LRNVLGNINHQGDIQLLRASAEVQKETWIENALNAP
jgi:hypothetical protein